MTKIKEVNVLSFKEIEFDFYYQVEVIGQNGIVTKTSLIESELKELCNDEDIVVYYKEFENEEGEELEELLSQMKCGYVEVETNADGSNEHDVYMHKFLFVNGEIVRDFEGEHLKTYKQEKSAIKFAEGFKMPVKIN